MQVPGDGRELVATMPSAVKVGLAKHLRKYNCLIRSYRTHRSVYSTETTAQRD